MITVMGISHIEQYFDFYHGGLNKFISGENHFSSVCHQTNCLSQVCHV